MPQIDWSINATAIISMVGLLAGILRFIFKMVSKLEKIDDIQEMLKSMETRLENVERHTNKLNGEETPPKPHAFPNQPRIPFHRHGKHEPK